MSIWQQIQAHVGVDADGIPGPATAAAIARALGLNGDGDRALSPAGFTALKGFEGLVLKAYEDVAGTWTAGYGHTGADVTPGMTITQAQADAWLARDVARFEAAVRRLCPVTTQGQFDALVCFAFNLGETALEKSTLRRLHNEGAYEAAAGEFAKWVHAGGRVYPGLVRRRAAEAAMYRGAA